jgi:membrane-associated phospholipid phosphatase
MRLRPTPVDLWCAERLASLLGKHPFVDLGIQSLIAHNVLGGFWFALSFFVLWVWPSPAGEAAEQEKQRKLLFILLGSLIAIAVALFLAAAISWLPPNRSPGLAGLYPGYLDPNPNDSSFPSASVTVYAAIAAGMTSFRRRLGLLLWFAVALLVALPRMYVGGHYLSDIAGGLVAALIGFAAARLVEGRLPNLWRPVPERFTRLITNVVVFAWILEVAVEFRDATWLVHGIRVVMGRLA